MYKCKKHFIKMLKDVGMVVPKIKETEIVMTRVVHSEQLIMM